MSRKLWIIVSVALFFVLTTTVKAGVGSPTFSNWTHWADVIVTWNGNPGVQGDWWVDKDIDGIGEFGCNSCVGVDYTFEPKGNTLQFNEVYVDGVDAFPQTHHVVLKETDEEGVYEGAITARYNYAASLSCPVRMDVIKYTINNNLIGEDGYFKYTESEYCMPTR